MLDNVTPSLDSFVPKARIGLLVLGHEIYWGQFPSLKSMGMAMRKRLITLLDPMCQLTVTDLVDNPQKSLQAGRMLLAKQIDLLFVFPLGYTASMNMIPAVRSIPSEVPIRILNVHEDRTYDYASADTATYLHHEGVCCVPEYAGALANIGRSFKVITGYLDDPKLSLRLSRETRGAGAAAVFRRINVGLIGNTYTGMSDMPIDQNRLIQVTGKMLVQPEVEEVEEAIKTVTASELEIMYQHLREIYDVDASVTNDHMKESARVAIAYERVVTEHDIDAFGYFWWGSKPATTALRSQSGLAVSRLSAFGRPGVTEGDVKNAMGMKILNLLGAGGMFTEFFSIDYVDNFILMGHDGPANILMAKSRPRLQHLDVHHGKTGQGIGIDFTVKSGPITLVSLTQNRTSAPFKLIHSVAEVIDGDILKIGNPNCRVRVARPIDEFIDEWCQQGPSHHISLGYGDLSVELQTFAESVGLESIRI